MKKSLALVAALLAVTLESGCGYTLAGRGSFLPAYIHRIGIPLFVNTSSVFDLDRLVTERVRSEFIGRGKYVIVTDNTGVDALLTGTITGVFLTPVAFNSAQQATRYALIMSASVEFKDMQANKVLWANPSMQYREEFALNPTSALDTTAFLGQNQNAEQRMADEFARALVSAILEAF
ncbi:MAG TPA: LPS assembly lipoprotein LptE [Vicinamibacterales bacterium]|nr:LPS assembly lipoprotein LptE [Vicinamibacterales bacterium]